MNGPELQIPVLFSGKRLPASKATGIKEKVSKNAETLFKLLLI